MEKNKLLAAIRVVKENEKTASDFYTEASKKTGSAVGRHLFEQLAEFEQFHYARLSALENSMEEKTNYISYEGYDFPPPPKIEPKAVEEPNRQTVMNIINRAREFEKEAEKAYSDLAMEITDPQGHAMFQQLSEEEHGHYRILTEAFWSLSNLQGWNWSRL
jgi:rubrerythrin